MANRYNENLINCPFYEASATQSISCEGITDECTTRLIFTSPKEMSLHRMVHCENKYHACRMYRLLEKKYEEE